MLIPNFFEDSKVCEVNELSRRNYFIPYPDLETAQTVVF